MQGTENAKVVKSAKFHTCQYNYVTLRYTVSGQWAIAATYEDRLTCTDCPLTLYLFCRTLLFTDQLLARVC